MKTFLNLSGRSATARPAGMGGGLGRDRIGGQSGRRTGGDWQEWEEPWWVTWLGCLAAAGLLALSLLLL